MSENTKTVANLKGQLSKYSGIISKEFSKAKRKLIKEMLYGIQAALIKTEDRLSRNLDDEDFTEVINEQICRLGTLKVTDDMVIVGVPPIIRPMNQQRLIR